MTQVGTRKTGWSKFWFRIRLAPELQLDDVVIDSAGNGSTEHPGIFFHVQTLEEIEHGIKCGLSLWSPDVDKSEWISPYFPMGWWWLNLKNIGALTIQPQIWVPQKKLSKSPWCPPWSRLYGVSTKNPLSPQISVEGTQYWLTLYRSRPKTST